MPIQKSCNKNFFKQWSQDMAYILGFLYADGCIAKTKRGSHFISVYSADEDLMVGIRAALGSDHKLSMQIKNSGRVYRLQIGSREIFDDISRLGLVPNKTSRLILPNIPEEFEGDFIRGYFDGDGNVWSGKINIRRPKPTSVIQVSFTSGSIGFLTALLALLSRRGVRGGSIYNSKTGNYGRLTLSTLDALKLYRIMYNSSYSLCLVRKRAVFEKFIEMRV